MAIADNPHAHHQRMDNRLGIAVTSSTTSIGSWPHLNLGHVSWSCPVPDGFNGCLPPRLRPGSLIVFEYYWANSEKNWPDRLAISSLSASSVATWYEFFSQSILRSADFIR